MQQELAQLEPLVQLVLLGQLELREPRDLRVMLASRVRRGLQVQQERREFKVLQASPELRA